jgi:hypothetical protein
MPWLMVNQIWPVGESEVPTPLLALDVQRAGIPGAPGAFFGVTGIPFRSPDLLRRQDPEPFQSLHRKLIGTPSLIAVDSSPAFCTFV